MPIVRRECKCARKSCLDLGGDCTFPPSTFRLTPPAAAIRLGTEVVRIASDEARTPPLPRPRPVQPTAIGPSLEPSLGQQ